MTFEEALKRLAEKEPGKFLYARNYKIAIGARFETISARSRRLIRPRDGSEWVVVQDDIDAILAEIGWEYELNHKRDQKTWTAWIWRTSDSGTLIGAYSRPSRTKIEAAKAALIAVVERECPK